MKYLIRSFLIYQIQEDKSIINRNHVYKKKLGIIQKKKLFFINCEPKEA